MLKKKPLFDVVITNKALEEKVRAQGSAVLEQENARELKDFKASVLKNLVKFWDDRKDIKIAIHETISDFNFRKDLVGWIRGDNAVNAGFLAEEIAKLTKENFELREKLNNVEPKSNVLFSSLTYKELEKLLKDEIFKINNSDTNLFDFLMANADSFSKGYYIGLGRGNVDKACKKLQMYKLVNTSGGDYYFTHDGHNFFLKGLAMAKL